MPRLSRRQFLASLGGLSLATGAAGMGWWHETEHLEVRRVALTIPGLQGSLRLAQLSDWHASLAVRETFLRRAIDRTLELLPDLICLTGDYTTHSIPQLVVVERLVRRLARHVPTFACLGNHDGTYVPPLLSLREATVSALRRGGATVLYNEATTAQTVAGPLRLAGVGDYWSGFFDPRATLPRHLPPLPTILLCHNPDASIAFSHLRWDLMLSGHSHGGQVNLPFARGAFAPIHDPRFLGGLVEINPGRQVYVNRGLGNLWGVRLRARPEITLFHLTPP